MKKLTALFSLLVLFLYAGPAASAIYVGKTDGSRRCSMDDTGDFYTTFSIQGGGSYSISKRASMDYVSTDLIHDSGRNYREPIGAIITIFGIGVKSVTLNLVQDQGVPTSFNLEVSGLFNDIQCNDLVKQ